MEAYTGEIASALCALLWSTALILFRKTGETVGPLAVPTVHRATALTMAVPTLILGIYWAPVMDTIKRALAVWG